MTPTTLKTLAAMPAGINAYSLVASSRKAKMHSSGRAFLRVLAADLGLPRGSFDIRSNKGGIAVSGEVTLHGESLYVQLLESCIGHGGVSILYRTCQGRKDYSGGRNNFASAKQIASDYPAFVAQCRRLMGQEVAA